MFVITFRYINYKKIISTHLRSTKSERNLKKINKVLVHFVKQIVKKDIHSPPKCQVQKT
jgi:hypothetical protein